MDKQNYFDIIVDFDDGLPWETQLRIHRTNICKRYLTERARVGKLAGDIFERTGSLDDAELRDALAGLEIISRQLQVKMAEILQKYR